MIGFLKYSQFPGLSSPHTKPYQHAWLMETLPRFVTGTSKIADVGANTNFATLLGLEAGEKWIIDPYDGLDGGGSDRIPSPPVPIQILQCSIGRESAVIADDYFDVIISSSVLEHVGQHAVNYDCSPTSKPPPEQETPRNEFCRECFRILRPGGFTFHTIDHAPRNITWEANFRRAGFRPIDPSIPLPTVKELLHAGDAVRQQVHWTNISEELPDKTLHSVLCVGYVKPVAQAAGPSAPRHWSWRELLGKRRR